MSPGLTKKEDDCISCSRMHDVTLHIATFSGEACTFIMFLDSSNINASQYRQCQCLLLGVLLLQVACLTY